MTPRPRNRRPEMATRSGLTECKRRQMPPGGDLFQRRRDSAAPLRAAAIVAVAQTCIDGGPSRLTRPLRQAWRRPLRMCGVQAADPLTSAGNMMPRSPAGPRAFIASDENRPSCQSFWRAAGANTRSAMSSAFGNGSFMRFMVSPTACKIQEETTPSHLAHSSGYQRKERHVLACRAFTPRGKRIDAEAAPRRID